jgi:CDGSH-type Zn-finger protein
MNNGPYLVTGAFTLVDADGTEYDLSDRKTVALCRCGGSTTKPFCDGTHSKTGFEAAERAVMRQQEGG